MPSSVQTVSQVPPAYEPRKSLQPVVDLVLSQRPRQILRLVDSLGAPPAAAPAQDGGEHSGIQLQRLLQLAWIVTLRAFVPSSTFYIGQEYSQGRCFVGATNETLKSPAAQLYLDSHDTVPKLFQQMLDRLEHLNPEECPPTGAHANKGKESGFNCSIIYQRQPVNTPVVESSEPELLPGALRLYVRHTADDHLRAQLSPGSSHIGIPLATSLLDSFNQALSSLVDTPTQAIGLVQLCSPRDGAQIAQFTKSLPPARDALLHDLCLQHVQTTPDAPAVRSWDGDLTYRELGERASRLAHWLVGQGVAPGVFVMCTFYRSTWAIVTRLAVLMAGGTYICLDAHDPPRFMESVLKRAQIKIALTSVGYAYRFPDLVTFEVGEASLQELPSPAGAPCVTVTPTDPCTVLFTSGSTGNPKAIVQQHRMYASALTDYVRVMEMGPHSRLFQFDAYSFDISNNDFLAPLIAGGCCCVPTAVLTMESLMNDVNDLQANSMFVTPSVAMDVDPARMPTLQTICVGGEPVSDAVLAKWLPRVHVVNQYGMGEVASHCALNRNLQLGRGAVGGRPVTGTIWITNPDTPNQLVPVGAVGELVVEGPHVSGGYLDYQSGKSENFLDVPPPQMKQLHGPDRPFHRMYRSGDLARYNHDGTVELLGRRDSMLKLDGARVEAGQIEYVLRSQLSTGDAAIADVLGEIDGVSNPILGVYLYLANNPGNVDGGRAEDMQFQPISERDAAVHHPLTQNLSDAVRQALPPYYIPSLFFLVDRVPRTKSNKTDRRKLHMLGQAYYVPHREELREITVWPNWN